MAMQTGKPPACVEFSTAGSTIGTGLEADHVRPFTPCITSDTVLVVILSELRRRAFALPRSAIVQLVLE